MKEIFCKMILDNGEIETANFDSFEEAWRWDIDRAKYHKNRRARADRLGVTLSFMIGCTVTGELYGGLNRLHGRVRTPENDAYLKDMLKWYGQDCTIRDDARAICRGRGFDYETVGKESFNFPL